MKYERKRQQINFEYFAGCYDESKWEGHNIEIKNMSLTQGICKKFSEDLKYDANDYYFKGVLSLCEAINSIDRELFSWATVKLYYSVYYQILSAIAANEYILIRKKGLYYLKNRVGEKPAKVNARSEHTQILKLFGNLFKSTDILQTNAINGISSYEWLMNKRHQVNYKERMFNDPDCSDFWRNIRSYVTNNSLEQLLDKYIYDKGYIYCFQQEDACLALPIKRTLLSKSLLETRNLFLPLESKKKTLLAKLLTVKSGALSNMQRSIV